MTSLAAHAFRLATRAVIKRHTVTTPDSLVAHLRRTLNNPPPLVHFPADVRLQAFNNGRISGDWLQVKTARRVVLYLHGGGYVAGITRTYHALCARLAQQLEADVFLVDYRLAPEHPFPAAVEDAIAAWEMILGHGWDPKHVIIMGDSAGGGLTLATLLKLRDDKKALPACAVALSPYADLLTQAGSRQSNDASDAMLSAAMFEQGKSLYAQNDDARRQPYASPVFGDYSGLPPLLLTVDETECLRDDAYAVAKRARDANVSVSMITRHKILHVWPIFYPWLPEAREDVARIIGFIRRTVLARHP